MTAIAAVYIVVHPDSRMAAVHLNWDHAEADARTIRGVMASLPILRDYREQEGNR